MGDRRRQDKNQSDDDKIASLVDGGRHRPGRSPSTPTSASTTTGQGGSPSASTSAGVRHGPGRSPSSPASSSTASTATGQGGSSSASTSAGDTDGEVDGGSTDDEFDPDSLLYDLSRLHHCEQVNLRQMRDHYAREEDLVAKYQRRLQKQQRFLSKINKNNEEKCKLLKKKLDRPPPPPPPPSSGSTT